MDEVKSYVDTTELTIVAEGEQLTIEYPDNELRYLSPVPKTLQLDTSNIYRPIQYLGSKYRPLPIILDKAKQFYKEGTHILDLFSGSSVVSQVFNNNGLKVVANDALEFNSVFANTLLGIGKSNNDLEKIEAIASRLNTYLFSSEIELLYSSYVSKEKYLLKSKKTSELLCFYKDFPQIWKKNAKSSEFDKVFVFINEHENDEAFNLYPLGVSHYAGTYFGIEQSLHIDRLRSAIEHSYVTSEINFWQYNFFLTCLLNVTSKIVFSAGKHFAQPIRYDGVERSDVLRKRFYEDRSKDVAQEFIKSVYSLALISSRNPNGHSNIARAMTMENLIKDRFTLPRVSVIYADPPYTAQQYSRFYHIPEIIYKYKYPRLQKIEDNTTTGLYPDDKFKSRFCSKRDAYYAFEDLFKFTATLNSSLLISYSSSLSAATGNDRMISLDQIIELGERYLPEASLEVIKFDFVYRQLNNSKKTINKKDDKEFLLAFKHQDL